MITIGHPSVKDYNLNLESLLGPENAVFFRGRVTSKNEINLPSYWEECVEQTTISVHIKRIGENKVFLQSSGGMPIDCYYLVIGERKDVPRLKAEQRVGTEG
jgi:hypothetical protein